MIKKHAAFETIVTNDTRFKQTKELAQKVAPTDANVLIYGETGTGKELFVQAIHEASKRKTSHLLHKTVRFTRVAIRKFIVWNDKGSYTGAIERAGLFELVDGGTLFLDELNSMPLDLQAKCYEC